MAGARIALPRCEIACFSSADSSAIRFGARSAAMNISFWPFMIYLPIWFQAGLGYELAENVLARNRRP